MLVDSNVSCFCLSFQLSLAVLSFMSRWWTTAKSLIGSGVTELPVLIELKLLSPQESANDSRVDDSKQDIKNMHKMVRVH